MAAKQPDEVKVIVFDLNGTFYNKSSKDEFYKFLLAKQPARLKFVFEMAYYKLRHKLHQMRQTEFKENFFNYLDALPPEQVEEYAREFWQREFPQNFNKELMQHFKQRKAEGIKLFCATGGLELYVKPLWQLFPIDGFAGTVVSYQSKTYKVIGKACKDQEKLNRMEKHFGAASFHITEAYSDSKEPILERADKAYLVKHEKLIPYSQND